VDNFYLVEKFSVLAVYEYLNYQRLYVPIELSVIVQLW